MRRCGCSWKFVRITTRTVEILRFAAMQLKARELLNNAQNGHGSSAPPKELASSFCCLATCIRALCALLHLAFSSLNLHRVWATCDVRNHASYRVMEKLGIREALFKKDVLQKGEWRDSYLYAVLAEEWE